MKVITRELIKDNYNLEDITNEIENSYRLLSQEQIVIPQRIFSKTENGGDYLYAGATNLKNKTYIVRSSSFMPWNKELGKSIYAGQYLYSNFKTGEALALVDGELIINLRTTTKTAVAIKYLKKESANSLGLIGLGGLSINHVIAISKVMNLKKVYGYSRDPKQWKKNIEEIKNKTGLEVEIVSKKKLLDSSDIVVIATHAKKPLFSFKDLHKGQTVISLDHAEDIDKDIVFKSDKVFTDTIQSATSEFGPIQAAIDNGYDIKNIDGELGELISKKIKGRECNNEIILFQSLGVTNEDLAVIEYLYELLKDKSKDINI